MPPPASSFLFPTWGSGANVQGSWGVRDTGDAQPVPGDQGSTPQTCAEKRRSGEGLGGEGEGLEDPRTEMTQPGLVSPSHL